MGLIIGSQQNTRPSSNGAVRFDTPQSLSDVQKETARLNIGVQDIAEFIINDLISGGTGKVLSAEMGKYLKQLIDALSLGVFYGFYPSSSDLPDDVLNAGYAYVGTENPYSIWNFDGTSWNDSGTTIDNLPDIVNNINTDDATKSLSAKMGKVLADGYRLKGIVTPSSDAITTENNVFYIASGQGTYTNFGGLTVNPGEFALLTHDSAWHKIVVNTSGNIVYHDADDVMIESLTPNHLHKWTEPIDGLTIESLDPGSVGVSNEYKLYIQTSQDWNQESSVFPSGIIWPRELDIKPSTIYEISIENSIGVFIEIGNE